MYEEQNAVLDPATGTAVVELIRALMGAPPEFAHLVAITDYLILVHQASETYVTHSRHNMYFMLPQLSEKKIHLKTNGNVTIISSDDPIDVENNKLNKALTNVQVILALVRNIFRKNFLSIQSFVSFRSRKMELSKEKNVEVLHQKILVLGKILGLLLATDPILKAMYVTKHQSVYELILVTLLECTIIQEKQLASADEKRACQGLVCEGLLLLLRDAVRVLPDSQVGSVLKHVLRAELLLVLANNPDARVRTALIKVSNSVACIVFIVV